jgi:hypothetical protein
LLYFGAKLGSDNNFMQHPEELKIDRVWFSRKFVKSALIFTAIIERVMQLQSQ